MRCKYARFCFVSKLYIYKDIDSNLNIFDAFSLDYNKILVDSLPISVLMFIFSVSAVCQSVSHIIDLDKCAKFLYNENPLLLLDMKSNNLLCELMDFS